MRIGKKKFDCLKMKSEAQRKVWAKLKGMTDDEQLAYWQERHRELEDERRAAIARQSHAASK
jgi:hypothetical protein